MPQYDKIIKYVDLKQKIVKGAVCTVGYLIKKFVKDYKSTDNPAVRSAYGTVCGICGIFLNIVLFAAKLIAGMLSGSLAVMADAFNNLSDAGSSVITLAGFRLAGKKPDPDHPFGHGRIEYISGLIVSLIIILMGAELAKASVSKLIEPSEPDFSPLTAGILVASVLVKLYMSLYNRKYGKRISSSAMLATASDSLSDMVSTLVVLISGIVCSVTGFVYIDSICGLLVAAFILIAGFKAARDTVSPLLGQPPSKEFVDGVTALAMSDPKILGIHDMVVHDYGPGRRMVSLHAEVSCAESVLVLHDLIDRLENKISEEMGCETVIHMDPIDVTDSRLSSLKEILKNIVKKADPEAMFHDLRIVPGETHTNLIFDVVLPSGCKCGEKEARRLIGELVREYNPEYRCVIKIDMDYTGRKDI